MEVHFFLLPVDKNVSRLSKSDCTGRGTIADLLLLPAEDNLVRGTAADAAADRPEKRPFELLLSLDSSSDHDPSSLYTMLERLNSLGTRGIQAPSADFTL